MGEQHRSAVRVAAGPAVGEPLRPVPPAQPLGRGRDHDPQIGGTVQGRRLGEQGRSEGRAEAIGPDDGDAPVPPQVDRDGAAVGMEAEREVEGPDVVGSACPQMVSRRDAQRCRRRRAGRRDACRNGAFEGDGPVGAGRCAQVRGGDLPRIVVLDREGPAGDAQQPGRPGQLPVEQLAVQGRGEHAVRFDGSRVRGHGDVEPVADHDLEPGGVDRCLGHLLGVEATTRPDPVATRRQWTDRPGAAPGELTEAESVEVVGRRGEGILRDRRRHGCRRVLRM